MNDRKKYPKRILVHDMEQEDFQKQFSHLDDDTMVLSKDKPIKQCIGCFGCWVKTPSTCVIKDDYQNYGKNLNHIDELVLISKCTYGGFSPFVKSVLERSVPSILPFFSIRNGEAHHTPRVKKQYRFAAHFYGDDITPEEKQTAIKLVKANEINFNASRSEIHFYSSSKELKDTNI
jgi:multimeric flavodoxin WrbA